MSDLPPYHPRHSLARAFVCAGKGIREFVVNGRNAKWQLGCAALAIALAAVLKLTVVEWMILIWTIGLVLSLEAMNTALERVVDLVSPQFHPLAGQAKDLAAGAVLIASFAAAVIGTILFLPKLLNFADL
ncbi:MAG TPA: diacylglycerol kinase family protein [Tepidisphaeraceae bacterium]|jgi:diacylglycerol kinase